MNDHHREKNTHPVEQSLRHFRDVAFSVGLEDYFKISETLRTEFGLSYQIKNNLQADNYNETADSILLYAGGHPLFVVDTYTHRIFSRHNLVPDDCDYQSLQDLFMDNLPHVSQLFNEYHALVVKTAKQFCKKNKPLCEKCPLFEG